MKMTMHVDSELLAKVMAVTGATTKTRAVDLALRDVARRGELKELAVDGLGLSAGELKEVFDPSYDLAAMRLAKTPVHYGRKPRSR
jgi:hypothetical protein